MEKFVLVKTIKKGRTTLGHNKIKKKMIKKRNKAYRKMRDSKMHICILWSEKNSTERNKKNYNSYMENIIDPDSDRNNTFGVGGGGLVKRLRMDVSSCSQLKVNSK